jgi:hypothetical protein
MANWNPENLSRDVMNRREVFAVLGGLAALVPVAARAQAPTTDRRLSARHLVFRFRAPRQVLP